MVRHISFVVVAFFCLGIQAHAQKHPKKTGEKQEEQWLTIAEDYFTDNNFLRALPYYQKLRDAHPDDAYYNFQLGICYLYKNDEKEKAITYLQAAKKLDPTIEHINYYLGRAYHLNFKFDLAIASFNDALKNDNLNDKQKKEVQQYINYCKNGQTLVMDTAQVDIVNLGSPVNTSASEYVPVITIDESTLIFTYRGPRSTGGLLDAKFRPDTMGDYYEDIMISQRVGDQWLDPDPINNINTKGHDASIALSNDGQILFIFKSTTKDGGDIFMSTLQGDQWSTPQRLGPNINTKYWEGSCSLSSDGQLLYFASDRPGGLGGRDIYVSKKQPDGSWGPAQNLGPTINTPYDDDAPFIHPDGIHLFFSSQGHNSMGGYDLFYAKLVNGKWTDPVNMGYPINSPADERYYTLTADGGTGYFSSNRRGGKGQQDIYTVTPGFQGEPPVLALVVGFVTKNGNPVDANINVSDSASGNIYGNFHSNAMSGKYLIALKPGNTYKVAVEVDGANPYFEYVNVKGIDTYVQVNKDYNFVTPAGDSTAKASAVVADSNDVLQKKLDYQLKTIRAEQNDQVYEQHMVKQILKKYGNVYDTSVNYTVDLGTYQNPADFDSTKCSMLGSIKREVTPDGVRYSVGPFKTLLDAELFRSRVNACDSVTGANSETVVYDHGVRKTIPQYYSKDYKRQNYVPRTTTAVIKSKQGTLLTTVGSNYGYNQIVNDYGNFQADGLEYKLEIASVKDSNDFRLAYFAKYGKIEKKIYPDGTIRYYLGPWKTLSEADQFKKDLVAKDSAAAKALVTVFYFGQRKTVPDFFADLPCNNNPVDLSWFKNKSLNDTAVYHKFLKQAGNYCADGLIYKVQIGAYRHPENFKYPQVADLATADQLNVGDTMRFTMKQFKTIAEAEVFRQTCIKRGIKDAWITAVYKGQRKTLEELIREDFYGKAIQ